MKDFARARDRRVLEGLEEFRYMRSDQIAELYFANIKNSTQRTNKVSERMKKLLGQGLVKRFRYGCEPFIYTIDGVSNTNKHLHYLTVVEVMIELKKQQKKLPAGSVLRWESEVKFDDIICDLHIEYRNGFRGERKDYFIEVELNSSGDVLQKLDKYRRLFRARRREGAAGDCLYVLCSKVSTVGKIERAELDMPVVAMLLSDLPTGWTW